MTAIVATVIAGFVALGFAIGLADLYGLRRSTRGYVEHGASLGAFAAHMLRLGATVVTLVLIARTGAAHFLAASGGFVAARFGAVAHAWWST
ncbi:MAG: ATP synthase subunit I [Polyangiales bacterium]